MLNNGVYPVGLITFIWFMCSLFDREYWLYGLWILFIWVIMTSLNYIVWKSGIPDLGAALKKFNFKWFINNIGHKFNSLFNK